MELSVVDKIKKINISICKKMFVMGKLQDISKQPSPLQFRILKCLMEHKNEEISQKFLEDYLEVSKATISLVLITMERNGLILRVPSKVDARIKNIILTDNSKKRFIEMDNIARGINEKIMKHISKEELKVFYEVIDKMDRNLEEID